MVCGGRGCIALCGSDEISVYTREGERGEERKQIVHFPGRTLRDVQKAGRARSMCLCMCVCMVGVCVCELITIVIYEAYNDKLLLLLPLYS